MVDDAATRKRLLLMARKLLFFMTGLGVLAVVPGMWLLGQGKSRSHVWFRWSNVVPVLLLMAIAVLVVVKPF
jgi:putative membrane protein